MRPYQQVAFQFSCHTFSSPGEAPVHKEWINIEESFPNFQFAEALRDAIGDSGSVLVWSHHEQSVVKDIVKLFGQVEAEDQALVEWLINLTDENAEGAKLIDLRKLCEQYYFHPKMKGSTSLKYVFPAIWESRPELHDVSYFRKYFQEQDGEVLNPYDVLDEIEIAGSSEAIREGTGAMRAYQEMMYGVSSKDEEKREKWKQLLLQYCELDTLAMVVVWEGWGRSENLDLQEIGES